MSNQSTDPKGNSNTHIHCYYVIGILIFILVLIIAHYCTPDESLVSHVSFAGTLSSLILSVLAIFITVTSNDSMSGLIHKIRDVSDQIKGFPETIDKSTKEVAKVTEELNQSTTKMKTIEESVTESVNLSVKSLNVMLTRLDESVRRIEKKQDEYMGNASNFQTENNNASKSIPKTFLQSSSFAGLSFLYVSTIAAKSNKTIILNDLLTYIPVSNVGYLLGFLVAIGSEGYIVYKSTTTNGVHKISEIKIFVEPEDIKQQMIKFATFLNGQISTEEPIDTNEIIKKLDSYVAFCETYE